ncbi:unnamed protein product [Phyllotreta striolata]|uniref:GRAM domain-containing protein n=1 Tax=Phyllotreta striolata TaxID=444603 RepID=A0A9N9TE07_PHYSR|nr:unnamed protein product [Phyllotreta striolata]
MSLNKVYLSNRKILLQDNEDILLFASDVSLQWSGQFHGPFHGTKNGFLYLTNERLIFINKAQKDLMLTFSFPYESLEEVELSQPGLGPNYLKGRVVAEPEGNWTGAANFKLIFKNGGALEFAKCMLQCSKTPVSASAASNEDLYEAPSFSLPLEVPLDYNLNDIQSSLSL